MEELRQGQWDARVNREREEGRNAGLGEDEAVQLALLLSMESEQTGGEGSALSGTEARWGDEGEEEYGYEDDYSYEYDEFEDSFSSIPTPSRSSTTMSAPLTRGAPPGSGRKEGDEFEGMSDGEVEAIKAVRDFERNQS